MRVPQSYIQKCKVVAHSLQAVLVFVATVLTIAVMTKEGSIKGATKYFLAMVSEQSSWGHARCRPRQR